MASAGDEGRGRLRKAARSRQTGHESQISEWGNPTVLCRAVTGRSIHSLSGQTRRTETSQYPQVTDTRWDSLSSGERTGSMSKPAQCRRRQPLLSRGCGVCDLSLSRRTEAKRNGNRTALERPAKEGNSPVGETGTTSATHTRVRRGTCNPVGNREDHLPRLNTRR